MLLHAALTILQICKAAEPLSLDVLPRLRLRRELVTASTHRHRVVERPHALDHVRLRVAASQPVPHTVERPTVYSMANTQELINPVGPAFDANGDMVRDHLGQIVTTDYRNREIPITEAKQFDAIVS